jgi:hypothetical protein
VENVTTTTAGKTDKDQGTRSTALSALDNNCTLGTAVIGCLLCVTSEELAKNKKHTTAGIRQWSPT